MLNFWNFHNPSHCILCLACAMQIGNFRAN